VDLQYASFDDHELEQYDVDRQTVEAEPLTEQEVEEKEVLSKMVSFICALLTESGKGHCH